MSFAVAIVIATIVMIVIVTIVMIVTIVAGNRPREGFSSFQFWSRDPAYGSPPLQNPHEPRSRLFRGLYRTWYSAPFARYRWKYGPHYHPGPLPVYYGSLPF